MKILGTCGALPRTKAFLCPSFLVCMKKASVPHLPPGIKQLLVGKWGVQRQEEKHSEKIAQKVKSSSSCSRDKQQSDTYLWVLQELRHLPGWVTSTWEQAHWKPQTGWNQNVDSWDSWNFTLLLHHQPIALPASFAFKNSSLKTMRSLGIWGTNHTFSFLGFHKTFLSPTSFVLVYLTSVCEHRTLSMTIGTQ